jgi:hypothetical protein
MMLNLSDFPTEADYVAAVKALPEAPAHTDDPDAAAEHAAVLALAPRPQATHVAIRSGLWSDANTWFEKFPIADAHVLIPEGVSVIYDLNSTTVYKTIRADGVFATENDKTIRLFVDTIVVAKTGRLEVVSPSKLVSINLTGSGPIDTDWDPMLLSRGILCHGSALILGGQRTRKVKLLHDPSKGERELWLDGVPIGWRVGDRVVITGTKFRPWDNHGWHGTYDESRSIEAIEGSIVTLNRPLKFNHKTLRPDLKAYVANFTSNVKIRSTNKSIIEERGHVMFLHNPDQKIDNVAFMDLGRTDKSKRAIEAAVRGDNRNVKGRYACHFHHTGVLPTDLEAVATNNAIWTSPGWGMVAHESKTLFHENASYDCFGAHFVGEIGNEVGTWTNNIAIRSQGMSAGGDWAEKGSDDVTLHDMGRTGTGFWMAGRLLELHGNKAAGVQHGFVFMHREAAKITLSQLIETPEMFRWRDLLPTDHVPIRHFTDSEVFATGYAAIVIKNQPAQEHDVRSVWDGIKGWSISNGIDLTYTGHYTITNLDLMGSNRLVGGYGFGRFGVHTGTNTFDVVIKDAKIHGFQYGVDYDRVLPVPDLIKPDQFGHVLIDVECDAQAIAPLGHIDPATDLILKSSDLTPGRLSLAIEPLDAWSLEHNRNVKIKGVKTDSIGDMLYPLANESFTINTEVLSGILYYVGFWRDPVSKRNYIKVPELYSDRVTGEVKEQEIFMWMDVYNNLGLDAHDQPVPNWKGPSYWLPHGPAKFLGVQAP